MIYKDLEDEDEEEVQVMLLSGDIKWHLNIKKKPVNMSQDPIT